VPARIHIEVVIGNGRGLCHADGCAAVCYYKNQGRFLIKEITDGLAAANIDRHMVDNSSALRVDLVLLALVVPAGAEETSYACHYRSQLPPSRLRIAFGRHAEPISPPDPVTIAFNCVFPLGRIKYFLDKT